MNAPKLKSYSAVFAVNGGMRRVHFDAADEAEAQATCERWGAGLEAEAQRPEIQQSPLPEAYDSATARRLLGGISRTSLYKELVLGHLDRVSGTRRVLITRSSLERRCRHR
jgi:hypothetical protein